VAIAKDGLTKKRATSSNRRGGHEVAIAKDALTKRRAPSDDDVVPVEVEGVGTVMIRPLSRKEAHSFRGREIDSEILERKLLAIAMVDPKMSEKDVAEWQANSKAGEIQPVMDKIVEISGMERAAGKRAYADFRE
jgi:hypothetical protein